MKKSIWLLLTLTACEPWGMSYEPHLSTTPKDATQYQADLKFCRNDMLRRMKIAEERHQNDIASPLFGPAGIAIAAAADNTGDDYYKAQGTVIDECLTAKGYKITQ